MEQIELIQHWNYFCSLAERLDDTKHYIDHKEYVVILDFIGNYNNNFMIPVALSGDRTYNADTIRKYVNVKSCACT